MHPVHVTILILSLINFMNHSTVVFNNLFHTNPHDYYLLICSIDQSGIPALHICRLCEYKKASIGWIIKHE
ncbi:MAG: hypothetical protein RLY17_1721 [Pseudomonadota bacterium]|jgi:hypothetical protein